MVSEWAVELGDELDLTGRDAGMALPLVPGPKALQAVVEAPCLSPEARLGLRVLYLSGIRSEELGPGNLKRPLALDLSLLEGARIQEAEFLEALESTGLAARFRSCGRKPGLRMFRHSFAVRCLEAGLDVLQVSRLLGHADLRTTEMYIACAMGSTLGAYARFHPLASGARGGTVQAHITESEAGELIASPRSERDRLLLRVHYSAGLRVSEVLGLCPGDLDSERGLLFIRNGKEDKDRYAILDAESARLLAGYTDERIFATTRQQVFVVFKRAANKLGLLEKYADFSLSPHSLRHACASHCYARGMDVDDVRKMLGHDLVKTTFLYVDCPFGVMLREYDSSEG